MSHSEPKNPANGAPAAASGSITALECDIFGRVYHEFITARPNVDFVEVRHVKSALISSLFGHPNRVCFRRVGERIKFWWLQ